MKVDGDQFLSSAKEDKKHKTLLFQALVNFEIVGFLLPWLHFFQTSGMKTSKIHI